MTPSDGDRYSRQIRFEGIGVEGQSAILGSRIAIVGCGALGSYQAEALARAGVGHLTLIDRDFVEYSNLQRQWLYDEQDAAESTPKAIAAARRLARINSRCEVEAHVSDLNAGNAADLLSGHGVILDATDNFETRYLINEYAVSKSIPWIYGAAVGSYGVAMPVLPGLTACFACVYPNPPSGVQPTCETAGVLSSITSMIAAVQVAAALRIVTGTSRETLGSELRMSTADVWKGSLRSRPLYRRDSQCSVCALGEYPHLEGTRRIPISLCGRDAVQIHERDRPLDLAQLRAVLEPLGTVRANEFALRFFQPPYEMTIFPDGRAIIKGTTDVGVARSLYARYVGA
jgi:molybdopterin-synthase adenylyltransferase